MKIFRMILTLALILYLSGCNNATVYDDNYDLNEVESFKIHHKDMYPLFIINGEVLLLDSSVENTYDAVHNTRIAVLFENHESSSEFRGLEYRNITKELNLSDKEEIIQVIDYFEGWLFLTNQGNVIKYELVTNPEMEKEFYVQGENNIITLFDNEKIIDMYYRDGFQVEVLRFETSMGRYFDFEEDNLNSIFGYELYNESIFLDGEEDRITLLDWRNEAYFVITNQERVLRYNTITKEVSDETANFPMNEGEKIVAFNYESNYRIIYVTNFGRAVSVNLQDYNAYNEFELDIELEDNEYIIDYQRGEYACREGMILITTNLNRVYILSDIDSTGILFDSDSLSLEDDEINNLEISDFGTNTCGGSSRLEYNGEEIFDFEYIVTVETKQDHIYLLGFLSDQDREDFESNYLIIKIK